MMVEDNQVMIAPGLPVPLKTGFNFEGDFMKFLASILAVVLFSNIALAYNTTYSKTAAAKETVSVPVTLPNGKSIVRVEGTHQENISCVFFDKGTGNVAFSSMNTTACVGNSNLTLPAVIIAKVTNNTNKSVDLQINVRDLP